MTGKNISFPSWINHNLLIPAACCYMAGAVLSTHLQHFLQLVLFPTAGIAVGILIVYKKPGLHNNKILLLLTLIFFVLVGCIHTGRSRQPPQQPSHIYNLLPERTLVTLDGTVGSMVSQSGNKSRFILNVHALIRREDPGASSPVPAIGKVQLSVNGHPDPAIQPGQRVLVVATVDSIHNYQTPGTFDYVLYMHNRGIYNSGWIGSLQQIHRVSRQEKSLYADFILIPEKIRQKVSRFLEDRYSPDVSGLYQALLIGEREGLSPTLREQYIRTGTMHLLSISGLHIGLLGIMLYWLFTWIMKRSQWILLHTHVPTLAFALSFPVLFIYACIAGMNTPVFRSLIMAAVLLFALVLRRQTSLLNLVAAAALAVLTISPLSLFTASFQLSFSAMLAIALVYPRLSQLFWGCSSDQEGERDRAFTLLRWPLSALLISIAATAGTLPFLLYHFNRFSPIGPIMNLLIEPLLCFIALPFGLLAAPLIAVAPDLAEFVFNPGSTALTAASSLTQWASRFPYASVWTITPSVLEILLYYLLLLWACLQSHRWKKTLLTLLSFLLIISFSTDFFQGLQTPEQHTKITFLDVGQGTATLFEFIDGTKMLLDGGGGYSERYNVGKNIIAPYLWKQRIQQLDTIIITHPDSDHYSGLPFIVERFSPQRVITNGQDMQTGSYQALMELIANKNIPRQQPAAGEVLHKDSLCTLTSLGMENQPVTLSNPTDNNQSVVLRLQCAAHTFLFPGDIEKEAEDLLLEKYSSAQLQANVFLAAHHGSKTSNSHAFLQAVAPELIIVSAGRTKKDIFPARQHKRWWEKQNIEYLITGINGTVTCTTNGSTLTTTTWTKEN